MAIVSHISSLPTKFSNVLTTENIGVRVFVRETGESVNFNNQLDLVPNFPTKGGGKSGFVQIRAICTPVLRAFGHEN